ncbi:uncharacterized protein LOC112524558 isoform X2 [Cynara cardunculus var. scolymus]|uniref:uncharacterized protein LOC112524558 isoform X2 n=1 Tax=Cynara cardunculus var. scolymus TaxID=59895 RepID=UPI000D627422|nr:uncharacterized protein LOC112524558 isoform X2 [Cynara cardunculus var. scolymus]
MGTEETRLSTEIDGKVLQIFSHFMERVAKFEEQAAAGNRYLVSFRQALEFIRRPSIDKTSELFQKVIRANETERIQSYIKAGCTHATNKAENLNKLNTSHVQLLNDMSKAKVIMNELECLVEDVKLAIETASETLQEGSPDLAATYSEEGMVSSVPEKPQVLDYATMVAVVYSMVKQDYVMQIVSSLNLKTSSGEIESYCLMWSLRPFVNDEIMHQAWRLIP